MDVLAPALMTPVSGAVLEVKVLSPCGRAATRIAVQLARAEVLELGTALFNAVGARVQLDPPHA